MSGYELQSLFNYKTKDHRTGFPELPADPDFHVSLRAVSPQKAYTDNMYERSELTN